MLPKALTAAVFAAFGAYIVYTVKEGFMHEPIAVGFRKVIADPWAFAALADYVASLSLGAAFLFVQASDEYGPLAGAIAAVTLTGLGNPILLFSSAALLLMRGGATVKSAWFTERGAHVNKIGLGIFRVVTAANFAVYTAIVVRALYMESISAGWNAIMLEPWRVATLADALGGVLFGSVYIATREWNRPVVALSFILALIFLGNGTGCVYVLLATHGHLSVRDAILSNEPDFSEAMAKAKRADSNVERKIEKLQKKTVGEGGPTAADLEREKQRKLEALKAAAAKLSVADIKIPCRARGAGVNGKGGKGDERASSRGDKRKPTGTKLTGETSRAPSPPRAMQSFSDLIAKANSIKDPKSNSPKRELVGKPRPLSRNGREGEVSGGGRPSGDSGIKRPSGSALKSTQLQFNGHGRRDGRPPTPDSKRPNFSVARQGLATSGVKRKRGDVPDDLVPLNRVKRDRTTLEDTLDDIALKKRKAKGPEASTGRPSSISAVGRGGDRDKPSRPQSEEIRRKPASSSAAPSRKPQAEARGGDRNLKPGDRNAKPSQSRRRRDSEDEESEISEDDVGRGHGLPGVDIYALMGVKRRTYVDDSDSDMEVGHSVLDLEERKSAAIGRREDMAEEKREMERLRRKGKL
ncbi:hypothetical protein HK101_008869 [Irineochytrium annulatum]|nr:hypothetical protein HK101_008869 [Irineochytrium annulatum]